MGSVRDGIPVPIHCSNCGSVLAPGDTFCGECGGPAKAVVPAVCPACGRPGCVGKQFCVHTGQRISSAAPIDVAQPGQAANVKVGSRGKIGRWLIGLLVVAVLAFPAYFIGTRLWDQYRPEIPPAPATMQVPAQSPGDWRTVNDQAGKCQISVPSNWENTKGSNSWRMGSPYALQVSVDLLSDDMPQTINFEDSIRYERNHLSKGLKIIDYRTNRYWTERRFAANANRLAGVDWMVEVPGPGNATCRLTAIIWGANDEPTVRRVVDTLRQAE
jgi:hypothetical protein